MFCSCLVLRAYSSCLFWRRDRCNIAVRSQVARRARTPGTGASGVSSDLIGIARKQFSKMQLVFGNPLTYMSYVYNICHYVIYVVSNYMVCLILKAGTSNLEACRWPCCSISAEESAWFGAALASSAPSESHIFTQEKGDIPRSIQVIHGIYIDLSGPPQCEYWNSSATISCWHSAHGHCVSCLGR